MKQLWKKHALDVESTKKKITAGKADLSNLHKSIAAIVPIKNDLGERLPQPFEHFEDRMAMKEIRDQVLNITTKTKDPESKEDAILNTLQRTIPGAVVTPKNESTKQGFYYRIDLSRCKNAINTPDLIKFLVAGGATVQANSSMLKVYPEQTDSPLSEVLFTLAKAEGRSR
jgi:hypothetical protein